MTKNYPEITKQTFQTLKDLREHIPEVMQSTFSLSQNSLKDGALSKKVKEMLALAIAVATRCDACIGVHTEALVKAGITIAELSELLGVAMLMGGGPAIMTSAEVMHAYKQFTNKAE